MFLAVVALATAEAPAAPEVVSGFAALGINGWSFLFQLLNFVILLLVLKRFAFKPLLKVLEKRRTTIEESLTMAAQVERSRTQLEEERRAVLRKAREEADKFVAGGKQEAQTIREEGERAGRAAAERLQQQGKAEVAQEAQAARTALQNEVLQLVAEASGEVLQEKIDVKKDRTLIERAVASASHTA